MLALRKRLWMEDGAVLVDGVFPLPEGLPSNPIMGRTLLPDFHIPIDHAGAAGGYTGALMVVPGAKVYASIEVVEVDDPDDAGS